MRVGGRGLEGEEFKIRYRGRVESLLLERLITASGQG